MFVLFSNRCLGCRWMEAGISRPPSLGVEVHQIGENRARTPRPSCGAGEGPSGRCGVCVKSCTLARLVPTRRASGDRAGPRASGLSLR